MESSDYLVFMYNMTPEQDFRWYQGCCWEFSGMILWINFSTYFVYEDHGIVFVSFLMTFYILLPGFVANAKYSYVYSQGVEQAMEWLLARTGDDSLDDPLEEEEEVGAAAAAEDEVYFASL